MYVRGSVPDWGSRNLPIREWKFDWLPLILEEKIRSGLRGRYVVMSLCRDSKLIL